MAITIIKEPTHGWRVKAIKQAPPKIIASPLMKPWTPGPHNCGNKGGCFCSGACMRPPGMEPSALLPLKVADSTTVVQPRQDLIAWLDPLTLLSEPYRAAGR